jgi:hypothetical protein
MGHDETLVTRRLPRLLDHAMFCVRHKREGTVMLDDGLSHRFDGFTRARLDVSRAS